MRNFFGDVFRIALSGESHSPLMSVEIHGVPKGLPLCPEDFAADIARRRPGRKGTTARVETDVPEIVRGVMDGVTTGTTLKIVFRNQNIDPSAYRQFVDKPRPGHADWVRRIKYGADSLTSGGGMFSGRMTLPIVAAGVVAKKVIAPVTVSARLTEIGGRRLEHGRVFPSMDTLVPMLRSFEGVVDCQITATCQTDSTMSILLPTLNASCFMRGKDMVLLDGETFAEISKTLMFKIKKRNLIDSIAVDLAIKDSKIEVFPFLVEMDRYKVAVGGTHNMDMTFDYHLSVLKSPVPFKLGIDITGNLDDFKFKIVRCKYKDFLQPAKQAELDSTRRNVRELIRDEIRRQIREAAPELGNSLSENHPFHLGNDEKGLTS